MTVAEKKKMLLDKAAEGYGFEDLITVVEVLRSPVGCPWDREQDHHSIRKDLIEETVYFTEHPVAVCGTFDLKGNGRKKIQAI